MCGGVQYDHDNKEYTVYFPNPQALLPVIKRDGDVSLLPWGRRQSQSGYLPQGGWARLESINQGIWDKYQPKAVKIPIKQFMEKDYQEISHWFHVTPGHYIQGLVAHYAGEYRVYIVTITSERLNTVHDRWPRIITSLKAAN